MFFGGLPCSPVRPGPPYRPNHSHVSVHGLKSRLPGAGRPGGLQSLHGVGVCLLYTSPSPRD
eukprot:4685943-Alexandrium_andersonii.AAC.1